MITIESPPSRFARVVHLRALGLERAGSTQPATATAPGALAPHGSCLYDVLVWVVATHVVVAATVSALSGAGRTAVILVVFGAVVAITALHQHGRGRCASGSPRLSAPPVLRMLSELG